MLAELLAGRIEDPDGGARLAVPVRTVVIAPSLRGNEGDLVTALGLPPPFAVVSDLNTHEVLGQRVMDALSGVGRVLPIRFDHRPYADENALGKVIDEGRDAGSFIAVGAGTINDLVKCAASRAGKRYAVFTTAPSMNGYASTNATITIAGSKKSLAAVAPEGIFVDLEVMAAAPKRLIRAGFADAICRSTAQVDWLMAHRLTGAPYRRAPFMLLGDLENALVERAENLIAGDFAAIECLTRALILSGFGMTIAGNSCPASEGEHLISHHLEMMPPAGWEAPYHGEQIAVTTLVMARLQEMVVAQATAPRLRPSGLRPQELKAHFGGALGVACWNEVQPKLLDERRARTLNERLAAIWPQLRREMREVMRPREEILASLSAIGAPTRYSDLGLSRDTFAAAVRYARTIRNRYTFLDLAADSAMLDIDLLLAD
jgi:glycerol-1-phosphate dehydrogenase [NAD(P)+]